MFRSVILFPWPIALTLCVALAPASRGSDDPPPIFDKRPYAQAKKAAEDDKKWFIVKATAAWCVPCKQMDRTTWRDEKVTKWLAGNAIAIVFDVDKDRALAKELAIQVVPTMIAFRNGEEFDRVVGYKGPEEFLGWLEGIARGEKSIELVRRRAGSRDAPKGDVDIRAHEDLAKKLARSGRFDEATEEYVWLWQHMLEYDHSFYGVRLSFMASEMERLAARHPAAKKKFTELRDQTAQRLDREKVDCEDLVDWVVLNKIVHDTAATLAWFDKVKDQPRWQPLIHRIENDLHELLIKEKRWADIGQIYSDPIEAIERAHEISAMLLARQPSADLPAEIRKHLEDRRDATFRQQAGVIYAGLLAAEREDDARKFAARTRELDESTAMISALISTALEAKQPRPQHLKWIDALASTDNSLVELREKTQAALDAKE